jgi:hypothetical protein
LLVDTVYLRRPTTLHHLQTNVPTFLRTPQLPYITHHHTTYYPITFINDASHTSKAAQNRDRRQQSRRCASCFLLLFASNTKRSCAELTTPSLGKSSLTVQFVENHFVESYYPTIENTFSRTIKYKGQEYATEIIDTAGQVCGAIRPRPPARLQGPNETNRTSTAF